MAKKPYHGSIFRDCRTTYTVVKSSENGHHMQKTALVSYEDSVNIVNSLELQKSLSLPLMLKSGINPQEINIKGMFDSKDICDNPNLANTLNQVASEVYLAENPLSTSSQTEQTPTTTETPPPTE